MSQSPDFRHRPPEIDSHSTPVDIEQAYRELERKYILRTYQAQELMIEKILYGHFHDAQTLQHKLHMFDLNVDGPHFMVVLVHPDHDQEANQDFGAQIGLVISSVFSELLGAKFTCCPANLDDRYAFLLSISEDAAAAVSADVATICRDAIRFIQDNFTFSARVCVSGVVNDLKKIAPLFQETYLVQDDPNTVFTQGVCVRAESATPEESINERPEPSIEKQYLNALVTQDFTTALQLTLDRIEAMFDASMGGSPGGSLGHVKNFLNQRMRTTSNVLSIPLSALVVEEVNLGEYCMQLVNCNNMAEIKQQLQLIFETLDDHFNSTPSNYTGTTGKVVSLISKRYMEPDLSVEMICDSLGKSRSYLSRMFKENTGMNLLDYLHTTRLAAAKKLLNDTNLGIAEIAARVGYYSGWTLARVFKRYEGITPTAYRKAFCSNSDA